MADHSLAINYKNRTFRVHCRETWSNGMVILYDPQA